MVDRGLHDTASLWPAIRTAYRWVHSAAHLLDNPAGESGAKLRQRFRGLLGAMQHWRDRAGTLAPGIQHFLKVTRSYWPGLFHCYDIAGLPRTNNDLEHIFGTHRYHERRTTGRKTGSPTVVIRGSVRVVAATATHLHTFSADDLVVTDPSDWMALRHELDQRRHSRVLQRRFRRNPEAYLARLEALLSI
jgi:hypothetical protein